MFYKLTQNSVSIVKPVYTSLLNAIIIVFLVGLVSLLPKHIVAEGTKEIMPYDTCVSRINLEPSFSNFAMYGCAPEERLNIHIENIGEKIYFGFGKVFDASQFVMSDLYYRIKDPSGTIVVAQSLMPTAGAGFISTYIKGFVGPNVVNSLGYIPLSHTPTMTGDYYIEFYYQNSAIYDRREIQYFDITVTNSSNQRINGRVWSKEWQFTVTQSSGANAYDNPFYGELYIYSDDSIVTSVDFNGLKPLVFAVSANATGTDNTGSPILDRMSVAGKHTYPQYKIFLNDPDSLVYPSGVLGMFTKPLEFSGCPGSHCIEVSTNKDGAIQLLIDLNGINGFQIGTADVMIVQNINSGTTCIPWNGLNGLGVPVPNGTVVYFEAAFVAGLTHMPIYDAESNPNGYIIQLVRPISSTTTFNLYWDDSNFPGATIPPSAGCSSTSGCHIFGFMFGDQRTVNTWWYAASDIKDSLQIVYSRIILDSIQIVDASCPNIKDGSVQIHASGGTPPISYSFNGGLMQSVSFYSGLGIGTYTILAEDSNKCQVRDTIEILSSPFLTANLIGSNDTCLAGVGSLSVNINSGIGPFQYTWSSTPSSSSMTALNLVAGVYTVSILDAFNCQFSFSDTIINVPSGIQISPTVLHDTCSNNMGQISLGISNAMNPLTYSWNTTPIQNTNTISNLGIGNYTVTILENVMCDTSLTFTIYDMPAPSPDFLIPKKACVRDSVLLSYIGNQTPPDSFVWTLNLATTLNGAGLGPYNLSYSQPGVYYLSLFVAKEGCPSFSKTDSIQLFELVPSIDSVRDATCYGFSDGYASISVSGGNLPYSYLWNPGGIYTPSTNQLSAGKYEITITDDIGCKSTIEAVMGHPDLLKIQFEDQKSSCVYNCDGTLTVIPTGGTPPYSYNWWKPSNVGNANVVTNLCPGIYNLQIVDKQNCIDTASFTLGVNSPILADFSYAFHAAFDEKNIVDFAFTGFGAVGFNWDFGDLSTSNAQNPTHLYLVDTTYRIELIANSGTPDFCLDTAVKWIDVLPPFTIFIPDGFTPNGDGLNDRFVIVGNYIKEFQILVFNRWGELVFESNSLENQWNGRYLGHEPVIDVYTYLVKVKGTNNKTAQRKGTITILK